jgi:hypothetical protein
MKNANLFAPDALEMDTSRSEVQDGSRYAGGTTACSPRDAIWEGNRIPVHGVP